MTSSPYGSVVPVWLVAAALALPLLGLRAPLIEVDDARYAAVPRAMAASGDWIVPSLNGMPYVEKPPLWYWFGAASISVFGASEGAARLPLLLLALLGAAGVFWLGSWLYAPRVGRTAALATATASLWLFLSHNMTLDMPVSVFLLWTTAFVLRTLNYPEDAPWATPAAWTMAALAFLSKGLIAVLLPALWTIALAVLVAKWRKGAWRLLSPYAIALAIIIAAPWFCAMQARRPDFLHNFFIEHHFQRYLTPRYDRDAAWWYYLVVLPASLLPWTAPFLAGFVHAARSLGRFTTASGSGPFSNGFGSGISSPYGSVTFPGLNGSVSDLRAAALAAWILGVIAFFSTSHSKLATYALPVVPHAALLAAAALDEGLPSWAENVSRALGALLLATGICLAVVVYAHLPFMARLSVGADLDLTRRLAGLSIALLAVLGAAQMHAPSSKRSAFVLGIGAVLAGLLAFALLGVASPLISAKDLALAVRQTARPEDEVWTYGTYLHGLPFYTDRLVDKMVYFVGEFNYAKREAAYADRFGDDNAVVALPRSGGRTFVAMKTRERAHFETTAAKGSISGWREFGPWSLAEVARR